MAQAVGAWPQAVGAWPRAVEGYRTYHRGRIGGQQGLPLQRQTVALVEQHSILSEGEPESGTRPERQSPPSLRPLRLLVPLWLCQNRVQTGNKPQSTDP